jgi:hypothetical protein
MSWKNQLRSDSLPWLLKSEDPGVRYLALRDLSDLSPDDRKLKSACKLAHKEGPIAHVLAKMNEEGYWQKPGTGYSPKYKSTVWALILLAVRRICVGTDPRLANALELIRSKQDEDGHWPLEYNYDGKTWMRFGKMKQPNEWVTLRALRVLKNTS